MKRNVEKYDYQVLNDAKNILMEIDMPKELYNPRCVMIFCACAQMIDGKSWRHISEEYMSVHDIIKYVNEVFPNKAGLDKKGYQENSRETFRDETLKRWVSAAIIESKAGLAANDRNNGYRFTSAFAALIRTYGSDQWEDSLSAFMETYESYSKKLKQVKSLPKGYDVICGNITVKLGLSAHNKLQKQILEEFVPNFASGAELLYIGDTSDRTLQRDDKRLSQLGIKILEDTSKLPDIILYDADKNRIIYVEAYSSTGEFNKDRVDYINTYCSYKNDIEVAFVTAFATTKKMLQVYPKIAWDTEIWIAEEATHLTHKNGDRFMGRSPEEFFLSLFHQSHRCYGAVFLIVPGVLDGESFDCILILYA